TRGTSMRHAILIPAILWFSVGALAQAGNDSCFNALFVGAGTPTQATNAGATPGPEPIGSCLQMGADVWFAYVPTCTGPHLATTCDAGTSFDTVVAVWDGLNGCSALIPLGCNDDSCGGLSSSVSFQAAV